MIYKIFLCACATLCNAQESDKRFLQIKEKYDSKAVDNLIANQISFSKLDIARNLINDINF